MFTQYERQRNQLCVLIAVHGELLEHPALLLGQNTPVNQKGHISITRDLFNKTTKVELTVDWKKIWTIIWQNTSTMFFSDSYRSKIIHLEMRHPLNYLRT